MSIFVIAEAGVNHDGSLEKAIRLVDGAKKCGADAIKFQSFSAERLASKSTPKVPYQLERDTRRSHFEMLKQLELSFEEQQSISNYCAKIGIEFMSTPYGIEDAIFLNSIGVSRFKIASADLVDIPLNEVVASMKKLVILSTGMCSKVEITRTFQVYKNQQAPVVLMHTTSEYPADYQNANLVKLQFLSSLNPFGIGYSDHTLDGICALVALGMGCTYFEKHITLDRAGIGPDHAASSTLEDFKIYVETLRAAEISLGDINSVPSESEIQMSRTSRKSLHFRAALKAGVYLQEKDLKMMRPGIGISWDDRKSVLGRRLKEDVVESEIVSLDNFE